MSGLNIFSDAINAYRDVEIAKRNQPRLVQGAQQTNVPMQRNAGAEIDSKAPYTITRDFINTNTGALVVIGGVVVGGVLLYSLIK